MKRGWERTFGPDRWNTGFEASVLVARAFGQESPGRALRFIREFYGPIAREHGTIYEKTSATSSLAHGWSVGFVEALVRDGASPGN